MRACMVSCNSVSSKVYSHLMPGVLVLGFGSTTALTRIKQLF